MEQGIDQEAKQSLVVRLNHVIRQPVLRHSYNSLPVPQLIALMSRATQLEPIHPRKNREYD